MKYYALTPAGVKQGNTLGMLNRQLKAKIEESELYSCGADRVVNLSNTDIEFVQDKKRLSDIPIANLYKSDGMQKYMQIFMLVLLFIILVRG